MNSSTAQVARLVRSWSWSSFLKTAIGLLVVLGADCLLPATALANGGEITAFTGKSAAYNTYYSSKGCGTCHGASYAVVDLKPYGAAFWNRLVAAYGSVRNLANEQNAMTDIEPGDADGDGYTNISEINANSDASAVGTHPTAAVALSTGQNAKSGSPTTTVSYTVTVTNNGNLTDSFTLGVSVFTGQSWTTSFTGTANNIAAGGTASITVNVVVAGAATNGQTSVGRVTAASQANGTISATPLDLTTTATVSVSGIRYVNASTGVNTGACTTSGSPCKTITYAMNQATPGNPGDLVSVSPGTYNLALGEVFPISLKSGAQLVATGSPSDTIIDAIGDTVQQGVILSQSNTSSFARIEGFTIKNGVNQAGLNGVALGGGIRVLSASGTVTIKRNVISGNEARGWSANGSPGMTGNLAWGGGLYIFSSSVSVTNNIFSGNTARGGDGFSHFGTPLNGNENGGQGIGGAIYVGGTGNITNNTFYGNSAIGGSGGGSSTGTGNSGDASNGAVSASGNPAPSVDNNIFANNTATAGAGGVAIAAALTAGNAPSIAKNLFFGNTVNGSPTSGDTLGTGSVVGDPLFASAPTNLRIKNTSPAKVAGAATAGVPVTDFDGFTRPSPPSIGAFEALTPVFGPLSSSLTSSTATMNGSITSDGGRTVTERGFVYSVNATNANPVIGGPSVTKVSVSGTTGSFGATVASLAASTTHAFKAYATNSVDTTYTTVSTFTTPTPTLSISDVSAMEGSSGQTYTFTVSLSAPSPVTVTAAYTTQNGTATAGSDYTTTSGTVTFTSGQTSQPISVPVAGDASAEADETFSVVLSAPVNATITKGTGVGVILNDDGGGSTPGISIDDPFVHEGQSGNSLLSFTISLSSVNASAVTVNYATSNGTAIAGTDYTTGSGTFTIPAGVTSKKLVLVVQGDLTVESDETFVVTLSSPTNAVVLKGVGTGTILNDDPSAAATTVTQYRLYHDGTKEHLYTTDLNEYTVLGTVGWIQEGIAYKMLTNGMYGGVATVPLFRMYHPGILQHHWTTDSNETTTLSGTPFWYYEATIGYVVPTQVAGTVPLYRMALASPALHLWTTDLNEYTVLQGLGWIPEGIIGYVVP